MLHDDAFCVGVLGGVVVIIIAYKYGFDSCIVLFSVDKVMLGLIDSVVHLLIAVKW